MAGAAASHPLFAKAFILKLTFQGVAETEYQCEVRDARITPTAGKRVDYIPLCPEASYSQVGADTFTLKLVGVQDWSANGLARLLWDHAGEDVDFEINAYGVANAADTPAMTGTAVVIAPEYGGEAETWAEFDLELPVTGVPALAVA